MVSTRWIEDITELTGRQTECWDGKQTEWQGV